MVIKSLLFTLAFLWFTSGFSQNQQPNSSDYNRKNYKRALAVWQIESLHNGVLLVRLSTKKQTINALRNAGHDEKADKIEKDLDLLNASIIQGFKITFDFCNVYFFESMYSDNIRAHKFDEVVFVDSLIVDESVSRNMGEIPVFTAEISSLQADTVQSKRGGSVKRQSGNTNMGISALVIKSDQFIQLMDPFPYYVREFNDMPFVDREPPKAIMKMNEKLHAFYLIRKEITIKKRKGH